MQYLEYKMDAGPEGMHTPYWVDNGGYWQHPTNHTLIGATRDNQEFKIPDTVTKLTAAELETRALTIHGITAYRKDIEQGEAGTEMTEAEVRTMIQDWVTVIES